MFGLERRTKDTVQTNQKQYADGMVIKIITGGQAGADQAGWRAAKRFGIPTGGAMPRGFLTEAGPHPEFAELYGAHELETDSYPARTEANVVAASVTLWFGHLNSAGYRATVAATRKHRKTLNVVIPGESRRPSHVTAWVRMVHPKVLNIAGNRNPSRLASVSDRSDSCVSCSANSGSPRRPTTTRNMADIFVPRAQMVNDVLVSH
jgi:Circularly permutated YpsA SLOG family